MGASGLKVQISVSLQHQRALHDPSQGIRIASSKTIGHFLKEIKIDILFNHKCSSCIWSVMCMHDFTHYIIMMERPRMVIFRLYAVVQKDRVGQKKLFLR